MEREDPMGIEIYHLAEITNLFLDADSRPDYFNKVVKLCRSLAEA
jgi:hypothetical protein